MISAAYARRMAAYNRWMNERMYDCCAGLPDEERKRDVGAFFKSIHGTLNHLLVGDRIWLGRFTGEPFVVKSLDQELYADFARLRSERATTDAAITGWVCARSDDDLAREFSYTTLVNPQSRSHPLWLAVTHFFNHQTHHRGQVHCMITQAGGKPDDTDLFFMAS